MKIVIASDAKQPNATYRGALLAAGALPEEVVVVTPGDPDPGAFDGLLLAGGADVAPALYGEAPSTRLSSSTPSGMRSTSRSFPPPKGSARRSSESAAGIRL